MFNPEEMRVLIVDDTTTNVDVLMKTLEPEGYNLSFAPNGVIALGVIAKKPPDLILLDIMMPAMNGLEVCKRLQENKQTQHIPIIFISGKTEYSDIATGFRLGASDYIVKPIKQEEVCARVRTHLEKGQLIKQLEVANAALEKLASLDPLTGIYNRRMLDILLDQSLSCARRYQHPVSFFMIDIDHFKTYNDHYGHVKGDECLQRVAEQLCVEVSRCLDIVARYGGEEFVMVMFGTTPEESCKRAHQCRKNIEALQIKHPDSPVSDYVTISIGVVAVICGPETQSIDLIKSADKALYQAKEQGRNCVIIAESPSEPLF